MKVRKSLREQKSLKATVVCIKQDAFKSERMLTNNCIITLSTGQGCSFCSFVFRAISPPQKKERNIYVKYLFFCPHLFVTSVCFAATTAHWGTYLE